MNKIKNNYKYCGGQIVITTVIFFIIISLAIVAGIATPTGNQIKSARDSFRAKQSYAAADAVNDNAFYMLNTGHSLPASIVLSFSDNVSATAAITDIGDTKQIITTGDSGESVRLSKSVFSAGLGASFNYGLQVGNGGINMTNDATIYGSVYSNGNITGSNHAEITGSALAGAVTNTTPDAENGSGDPTGGITLGKSSDNIIYLAQSFTVATSTPVIRASFNVKKNGTPSSNITVKIMTNSSGNPSSTQRGGNAIISASQVTGSYGYVDAYLSSGATLTPGTTYWLRVEMSGTSATNYYTFGTNLNQYGAGSLKTKTSSGSWTAASPAGTDEYFAIYTGQTSTISGMDRIGGTASAFTVNNSTITGNLYCQTGSGNNKACDTSTTPPSSLALSVSDANIDEWKDIASAGYTSGSISLSGDEATTTTGALKVNGSVSLSNDAIITLNGPLYVTGNITLSNKTKIKLSSSYGTGSSFIIVDGTVNTSNEGEFQGSGQSGSYIMLASKNGNINISNHGGSVVLVTLNGTVNFSNDATAKAVVARSMQMSNHTTLNYESGLANLNFTGGPSGSWQVESWQEVAE